MRALRFLNLGILAALLASSAVLYAQDDKQQEEKPKQEEPKRQQEPTKQDQARPETRQDQAKPAARQDEVKPRQDEGRSARPEQQGQQRPEQEQRPEQTQPRNDMRPAQQEPNRQEQGRPEAGRQEAGRQETGRQETGRQEDHDRGGNRGRIPDERFRAEFGREHHFAMPRPQVVSGRPEFQYGGYTFILVDPWPPAWAYSDDCYIDYVDGYYYLFNLRHPEARLALEVVM